MANEPIQGFDVQVNIVGPNGPELVGAWEQIDFDITEDSESYLSLGERIAQELDGEIKIGGTLKRGWRNMDVIQRIWGVTSLRRGQAIPPSPRFEISCNINAPAKGLTGRFKLERCKITKFGLSVAAGKGVVKGDMPFKAEGITSV